MTSKEVLRELEALGTEQYRKIYRRHGASDPVYGVSYANLEKLKKQIKVDQPLASELWASGVHDARILATMIADAAAMDGKALEAWAADVDNHVLADALAGVAARSPDARKKAEKWARAKGEAMGRLGWSTLGHLAARVDGLPDHFFESYLATIERDVHIRQNRIREAMNSALIAIGGRNDALAERALAVAERVGPVAVDHGETNCKTPDAVAYIRKMRERQRSRKAASGGRA